MVDVCIWNMQGFKESEGWEFSKYMVMSQGVDFFLAQECGGVANVSNKIDYKRDIWESIDDRDFERVTAFSFREGSSSRGSKLSFVHYCWDTGANRVNLSILSRHAFGQAIKLFLVQNQTWNGRPLLGMKINAGNGFIIANVHASASGGGDAVRLLFDLELTRHLYTAGQNDYRWWCGGDFNCAPQRLNAMISRQGAHDYGFWLGDNSAYTRPASRKILDYGIGVEQQSVGSKAESAVISSLVKSDHRPVLIRSVFPDLAL